jgi:YHS domain-containing protein
MRIYLAFLVVSLFATAFVILPGCPGEKGGESGDAKNGEHEGHERSLAKKADQADEDTKLKDQETCPVMGNPINKDVYVDHEGKRIYFCCPGCDSKFKAEPQKYLKKLREMGEKPVDIPK